ncbi:MAG: Cob(I)yrinic acid a,c-diamide adenosyltransferase [Bacteroidota bacterium]
MHSFGFKAEKTIFVIHMKIYTKQGDKGFTRLADGQGIPKSDFRLEAIGDIDELNCHIGLLICRVAPELAQKLQSIQSSLFVLGAHVASDSAQALGNMELISLKDIVSLEENIDEMDAQLSPMRFFILPGGHESIATAQIARTVCRRAERSLIRWVQATDHQAYEIAIAYINRLSDYLFMMCRFLHHSLGIPEIPWNSGK